MFGSEPEHVGIKEKKKNETDGKEIHIEKEEYPGMEKVPFGISHTAECIDAPDNCDECRNDKKRGGAVIGEAGQEIGGS